MDDDGCEPVKACFKCKAPKLLSAFYTHPRMKDGHLNKCIECTRADSHKHRSDHIDSERARDRARGFRAYDAPDGRLKAAARSRVRDAIARGSLVRGSCEVCGEPNVHGHHDDYSKPLDVRWLCKKHHSEWHRRYN